MSRIINKNTIWCTYYKKSRHTRNWCWKRGFKGEQQRTRAYFTNSHINENPLQEKVKSGGNKHTELKKEEIKKLKNLLGTLESPSGACSLTQPDKYSPLKNLSVSNMSFLGSWVINSDAIDHMTHSSQKFSTYSHGQKCRDILPKYRISGEVETKLATKNRLKKKFGEKSEKSLKYQICTDKLLIYQY